MADQGSTLRDAGRFNAFTDGVMVVSMTLLILNVQLPDGVSGLDGGALWVALTTLWPHYVGYVVSFLVIAQYWLGYTDYFGGLRGINDQFARLNVLFLLAVGFVPFVTSLLSENNGRLSTSLYALSMIVVSMLLVALALQAINDGLVARRYPPGEWWREVLPWLKIMGVFGASLIVAQFDARAAKLVWALLAIPELHRRLPPHQTAS